MSPVPELNRVQIAGRLARPPKAKRSLSQIVVAELTIALRHTKQSRDGSERIEITYVLVELWDRPARKLLALNLPKGSGMMIEGVLGLQTWKDGKTGEKRNRLIIYGNSFTILDRPGAVYEPEEEP